MFLKVYLFLSALGLLLLHAGALQLVASRGYSLVVASRCGGFSCCRAWALGLVGFRSYSSQAVGHRLSSCVHGLVVAGVGSFQTRG